MGVLDHLDLPDPEQARKLRPVRQKWEMKTRLDVKEAKQSVVDRAWEECKRLVDVRDQYKCRCCGRRTKKTIELCSERAEHHHIATRRKFPELLTDVRNVILLCYTCHEKITRRVLHVIGKAKDMFELNGKRFLNADKPLEFT